MTQTESRHARFVSALAQLDRGQLAELRRSLGDREAFFLDGVLARVGLGFEEGWRRRALHLVAGLYALVERPHDKGADDDTGETTDEAPGGKKGPSLGALLGRLYLFQDRRPSTEKRFLALLDSDVEGLEHHVRQAVTLLRTEELTPDWARLADDLAFWGDSVRRTWARDFYRTVHTPSDSPAPESGAADPEATA